MNEIVGQRKIISKFAAIPENYIVGYRAPFLQTSGDTTFKVIFFKFRTLNISKNKILIYHYLNIWLKY